MPIGMWQVINNPFEEAVQLTHALYNFAALHLIAEEKNDPLPSAQLGENDLLVADLEHSPQLPVRRRSDASRLDRAVPHASALYLCPSSIFNLQR